MLNKLLAFLRQYEMALPGDRIVCAVSGGADSVALLFAMHLLSEKLQIKLEAAHFNHHLRGEESDRDEMFVRAFCNRFDIPLHVGCGNVIAGKKGLEAAARDARYGFLNTLSGKIATAHTADDNAETMLMHLIRGTGLRGLGGISPVSGKLIRPMLGITREEVIEFLSEYNLQWVNDSSNQTDEFLRNRLRRHVLPLLKAENPSLARNLSATALRLRNDEEAICSFVPEELPGVSQLRTMQPALRYRALARFLASNGLHEAESEHISLLEKVIFSDNPSACAHLSDNTVVSRKYDTLVIIREQANIVACTLAIPGSIDLPQCGVRINVCNATEIRNSKNAFTVELNGSLVVRSRIAGDRMRLSGGSKDIKKLFIDRKIPAHLRNAIPVLADDAGVLGVYGIGANIDRLATELPCIEISFEEI